MKMKKLLSIVFLFSLIVNFTSIAPNINAMQISEGAIIKTDHNPDVYIIKYKNGKQFKRLVLNPQIFESYGHLRWEDILIVDQSIMNSFVNSNLVRVDGQADVCQLIADGDIGSKHYLMSNNFDLDSVYTINSVDFDNYTMGEIKETEKLERLTKSTQALEQLLILISEADNQLDILDRQMEEKKTEIKNTRNTPGTMSYINGMLERLIPEYNSLVEQYNNQLELYKKMLAMKYMIDDYKNNIYITIEDRAFLEYLGINL